MARTPFRAPPHAAYLGMMPSTASDRHVVAFHSPFNEPPDLSTPEAIRDAMRESYARHMAMVRNVTLPPNTSLHDASMYGVLSSFYDLRGTSPAATAVPEPLRWLELLPFLNLPEQAGLEALIEYIIWKEGKARSRSREEWLASRIQAGTMMAIRGGWGDRVQEAMDLHERGPIPWARLLLESLQ